MEQPGSLSAAAAGFPDAATLERLANEFFEALPAHDNENVAALFRPAAATTRPPFSIYGSGLDAAGDLTEADLAAIPAALQSAATPAPTALPDVPELRVYGIPGGISVADFSSIPSYGFVEDVRPLFSSEPTKAVPAAPPGGTVTFPAETELSGKPPALPGAVPLPVNAKPQEPTAPQLPGAVTHDVQRGLPATYGFINNARPIALLDIVPALEPLDAKTAVQPLADTLAAPFDVASVRRDFPILQEQVSGGRQLVWLDNAATTQKPQSVIDRLTYFYQHENSNVHRAAHELAARSTDAYEAAREKAARFLNASAASDIVFVRGATEGINLVAQSWGRRYIQQGEEIIITWLEHHANIVPWQQLASEKNARLRVAPVDDSGQILLDEYEKLFTPRTRLVSLAHVSNALGTITPVAEMIAIAHRHGARVLVDGAQAVSHMPVDVQALDADFYVFSGHKVFGPNGIGVLYGKPEALESTPPWQGGGNMIVDVTFEKTIYQDAPARFEAGTGSIADAAGLGAAIDYASRIGMANIARYEHNLLQYGIQALQRIPGLRLIGTAREKASVLSFVLDGFSTEDVGKALSREGIAVRAGHHCAQPVLRRFGLESTVRPSLAFYNTCEEIDALAAAVWNLKSGRGAGL